MTRTGAADNPSHRWPATAAVVLACLLAGAACGTAGSHAATGSTKPTSTASAIAPGTTIASTTTSTTTVPQATTTTTPALSPLPLDAVIIPAPAGFAMSHRVSARNGPVTAAGFNQLMSSSTFASDVHYVGGYQMSYDSVAGQDSIDVLVADFATADDAQNFQGGFVPSNTTVSTDDPAIVGADDFNSTNANPDGSFDHGVVATKGKRAMVIDYYSGNAAAVPVVATMAQQQYAKM